MFIDEMWDVIQDLQIWDYRILDTIYENHHIHSITFTDKNNIIIGLIIAPHDNINKFIIRAEVIDNFDGWDNCSYEVEYNWEHFYSQCYSPLKLYQELLCIYANVL